MIGRRSHIRSLLISALVGVAITVIISWLAMFLPWNGQHWYGPSTTEGLGVVSRADRMKSFQITRGSNAWHSVTSYWWMQISGASMTMMSDHPAYREIDLHSLPSHMRPRSIDDLDMQSWYHQTGWPMPALTCGVHWETQILNSNVIYSVSGGVQLPRDAEFNPRALPLTPLWPGFAVNVLLYGGAWWLLMWAISAMRRHSRVRRNRCVHCGYSRDGLPADALCPECGGPSHDG